MSHFSSCESIRKIEKIQKRCLRLIFDNYDSNYDVLLRKSGKVKMEIKRLRVLAIEISKTADNLNPNYMKDIFTPNLLKLFQPLRTKTLTQKCLSCLGPFIWNGLPDDVTLSNNVNLFKHKVKKSFLTILREKDQDIYVYYAYT